MMPLPESNTEAVIERLAGPSRPVRRLRGPLRRTVGWLLVSSLSVAVVVLIMSPRADLLTQLTTNRFVIEQLGALLTAVFAAYAAFTLTIPGRSRAVAGLVALPLAIWLASLGEGCWQSFVHRGPDGLYFRPDWICLPAIAMVGAVPAIAIVTMIRRGAPMVPRMTVALGALAAAALGNFGLRLFHTQDASLMVLVWQFGTVVLLTFLGGFLGRRLFSWSHVQRAA